MVPFVLLMRAVQKLPCVSGAKGYQDPGKLGRLGGAEN